MEGWRDREIEGWKDRGTEGRVRGTVFSGDEGRRESVGSTVLRVHSGVFDP